MAQTRAFAIIGPVLWKQFPPSTCSSLLTGEPNASFRSLKTAEEALLIGVHCKKHYINLEARLIGVHCKKHYINHHHQWHAPDGV